MFDRSVLLRHSAPYALAVENFNLVEHIRALVTSSRLMPSADPARLRESEEVFASSGIATNGFSGEHNSLVDLSEAE